MPLQTARTSDGGHTCETSQLPCSETKEVIGGGGRESKTAREGVQDPAPPQRGAGSRSGESVGLGPGVGEDFQTARATRMPRHILSHQCQGEQKERHKLATAAITDDLSVNAISPQNNSQVRNHNYSQISSKCSKLLITHKLFGTDIPKHPAYWEAT